MSKLTSLDKPICSLICREVKKSFDFDSIKIRFCVLLDNFSGRPLWGMLSVLWNFLNFFIIDSIVHLGAHSCAEISFFEIVTNKIFLKIRNSRHYCKIKTCVNRIKMNDLNAQHICKRHKHATFIVYRRLLTSWLAPIIVGVNFVHGRNQLWGIQATAW